MRDPNPLSGVPDNNRYAEGHNTVRGEAGRYQFKPVTLEEEAYNRGWLPGARPTGPDPIDLMTIGMRGEPGWDDNPQAGLDGHYHHTDPHEGPLRPMVGEGGDD